MEATQETYKGLKSAVSFSLPSHSHSNSRRIPSLQPNQTSSFKMFFPTITALFAAAVLAAPIDPTVKAAPALPVAVLAKVKMESVAIPHDLLYQGDGFYQASFNDSGHVSVTFTPQAELDRRVPTAPTKEYMARNLSKRAGTTCAGKSDNVGDLDYANDQMAHRLDKEYHPAGSWGWVSLCSSRYLFHIP